MREAKVSSGSSSRNMKMNESHGQEFETINIDSDISVRLAKDVLK